MFDVEKYHPARNTVGGGGILRHSVIKDSIGSPNLGRGDTMGVIAVVCEQIGVLTRPHGG